MRRDSPPSPPPDRLHASSGHALQVDPPLIGSRIDGFSPSDRIRLDLLNDEGHYGHSGLSDDEPQVILPDRPTLCYFSPAKGSPFGWLKGSSHCESRPRPFRELHERLGLTIDEFQARLASEIDEVLTSSEEDRRRARAPIDVESASSSLPPDPSSLLTVPSKMDCVRLLSRCDLSKSGALLGAWCWAADLGSTRFNFDFDWEKDDLSILNAYD